MTIYNSLKPVAHPTVRSFVCLYVRLSAKISFGPKGPFLTNGDRTLLLHPKVAALRKN